MNFCQIIKTMGKTSLHRNVYITLKKEERFKIMSKSNLDYLLSMIRI